MTNIDKYEDLLDLFASTNDRESMRLLFEDMFTDAEIKDLEILDDTVEIIDYKKLDGN